ncbi:MAG: hypothetical protein M3237_05570 [Actinomycetota bacterium]|nr:hypothetical protein [Actinomycetota bacterium]
MSQPPYGPPTEPPNEPPSEPPPNPPPPIPGQRIPPEQLPPPPGPPPAYGAPVPPPAPKKSRAGLVIGLAVAGIAVVAGLLVVGLLVSSDDDSDDAGDEEATSSTVPEGDVLRGDGYSYGLPDEWQDITDEVTASDPGTTLDTGSAWGDSIATGRANLIVEVTEAGGTTDLDDARNQLSSSLATALGVTPEPIENRTIGGEEAAGLTITRTNELDVEILQTAYVTIVDETAYVITTTNKSGDDAPQDAYDAIYGSWSWE